MVSAVQIQKFRAVIHKYILKVQLTQVQYNLHLEFFSSKLSLSLSPSLSLFGCCAPGRVPCQLRMKNTRTHTRFTGRLREKRLDELDEHLQRVSPGYVSFD